MGTVEIKSVASFVDSLSKINSSRDFVKFFRGHAKKSYELVPSIYRNRGLIDNEDIIFQELLLKCPQDFERQATTFETLVKMQHYLLPTRLLDVTSSPLVALYFACKPEEIDRTDESGEVVVFRVPKAEIKYFDSDTVSVLANISRRPAKFRVPEESEYSNNGAIKATEELRIAFNKTGEMARLLHEIGAEKPYFKPWIFPPHLGSVVCVKPKLDNARVTKQDGAFFLFGIDKKKENCAKIPDGLVASNYQDRLVVPDIAKENILRELKVLGITDASLFPEIGSVATHIKSLYSSATKSQQKH